MIYVRIKKLDKMEEMSDKVKEFTTEIREHDRLKSFAEVTLS